MKNVLEGMIVSVEGAMTYFLLGVGSHRVLTSSTMLIFHFNNSADRVAGPPREDLPLPTQPPYTAFIGNLAFDLTEIDLEEFFVGHKVCLRQFRRTYSSVNCLFRRRNRLRLSKTARKNRKDLDM